MLRRVGCEHGAVNEDGDTALMLAQRWGHSALVELLQPLRTPAACVGRGVTEEMMGSQPFAFSAGKLNVEPDRRASDSRGLRVGKQGVPATAHGSTDRAAQPIASAAPAPEQRLPANEKAIGSMPLGVLPTDVSASVSACTAAPHADVQRDGNRTVRASDSGSQAEDASKAANAEHASEAADAAELSPADATPLPSRQTLGAPSAEPWLWSKDIAWDKLVSRQVGNEWMQAAQSGDVPRLEQLAGAQPWLLAYRGKGTSFGFCGARTLHLLLMTGKLICI